MVWDSVSELPKRCSFFNASLVSYPQEGPGRRGVGGALSRVNTALILALELLSPHLGAPGLT